MYLCTFGMQKATQQIPCQASTVWGPEPEPRARFSKGFFGENEMGSKAARARQQFPLRAPRYLRWVSDPSPTGGGGTQQVAEVEGKGERGERRGRLVSENVGDGQSICHCLTNRKMVPDGTIANQLFSGQWHPWHAASSPHQRLCASYTRGIAPYPNCS